MRSNHKGSPPRLLLAAGKRWEWRAFVCSVAALTCIGVIAGGMASAGVGISALAQATLGAPTPPDDAPLLIPGQRVRRPFG